MPASLSFPETEAQDPAVVSSVGVGPESGDSASTLLPPEPPVVLAAPIVLALWPNVLVSVFARECPVKRVLSEAGIDRVCRRCSGIEAVLLVRVRPSGAVLVEVVSASTVDLRRSVVVESLSRCDDQIQVSKVSASKIQLTTLFLKPIFAAVLEVL